MKQVVTILSIVCLTVMGMAQNQQNKQSVEQATLQQWTIPPHLKELPKKYNPQKHKSQKAMKMRWDSLTSNNHNRILLTYDNNNTLLKAERDILSGTFLQRTIEHYTKRDTVESVNYRMAFDSTTQTWIEIEEPYNKSLLIYITTNGMTEMISAVWDYSSQTWIYSYKIQHIYDNNTNLTISISYNWDVQNNTWIGNYKNEEIRDNNNNLTMEASYNWNIQKNKWIGVGFKKEYAYDNNGNQTMYTSYDWDRYSDQWLGFHKEESIYDNNNNQITNTRYLWDEQNEIWVASTKYENTFDNNNSIITNTHYLWDEQNEIWAMETKTEYMYDQHNNRTSEIQYQWINNQWELVFSETHIYLYQYNANNKIIEFIHILDNNSTLDTLWMEQYAYDNNDSLTMKAYYIQYSPFVRPIF